LTHLPIIGDPSHATGLRSLVHPMSLAIISSGASGIIVEVHNHPEQALSDGPQSLYPEQFEKLMRDVEAIAPVVGKSVERIPRPHMVETGKVSAIPGEESKCVAFQGERGAYSELAVTRLFGEQQAVKPCKTFKDVFDAVDKGDVRYGVVPVENTLGGTIYDTLDLLAIHPGITVVGEQQIRIVHDLIVLPGTKMEEIKEVYSHPQGLAQCAEFLAKQLPGAKPVPFFDTAGSVSYIKERGDKSKAAIAGTPAASYYKMEVLREGIETNPSNYTRFYVICREENAEMFTSALKANRAVLSFSVDDRPGSLFDALQVLSVHKLNMKKLESRPIFGKPWEYSFFVETEMPNRESFDKAVEDLRKQCTSLKVHGTFFAG